MTRVLVTGAAGFIGSGFVRLLLRERTDWHVIGFDALTYAGNLKNIADCLENDRFRFVRGDICDSGAVEKAMGDPVKAIVNFAAESHVDRSIMDALAFTRTNFLGVHVLLDAAKDHGVDRFLQVSTDEVYGSLGPTGKFTEQTPIAPNSPYSASKAAADLLAMAYYHTHDLPVLITRCSNNYGPYQFPEKLIALFVTNLLEGRKVPLYGDGLNVRDWIHVDDHCSGILAVLERAEPGTVYNLGGNHELRNIEIAKSILSSLQLGENMIEYVPDRPGHDRRYAMDITRAAADLQWQPTIGFEEGLAATIDWYRGNTDWWQEIKSGAYREYYEQQYGRTGGVGNRA